MKALRWIAGLVLALALGVTPVAAETVTVFAAASLKDALNEVGGAYKTRTGVDVRVSYAATSAIARQIEQGAPADLFVSADVEWMDYLADRKLIDVSSRRDLLGNRLVLIAPAGAKTSFKLARGAPLAKALGGGRLAVAAPQVPAGKYARAALGALGIWDSVSTRTVDAENVRTALQYVARGEAPFGVVYETDAFVEPKVRIVGVFPASSHPPIIYPAAVTASAKGREAAKFLSFMSGRDGMRIFRKYGFTAPAR